MDDLGCGQVVAADDEGEHVGEVLVEIALDDPASPPSRRFVKNRNFFIE